MNNPCRKCAFCFTYNNRCYPAYNKACSLCDKRKKYEEYKQSKRMFVPGDVITTLDELLEQEWVIFGGMTRHIEFIKSLQLRIVIGLIKNRSLRKAVRKEFYENNQSE